MFVIAILLSTFWPGFAEGEYNIYNRIRTFHLKRAVDNVDILIYDTLQGRSEKYFRFRYIKLETYESF